MHILSLRRCNLLSIGILIIAVLAGCATDLEQNVRPLSQADNPWWQLGRAELDQRLAYRPRTGRAKNVILFVGDGMGVSTVTAARIFDGQSRGEPGEENTLSFERMPNLALVKTYNTNAQVPDSAATAGAMNTGIKMPFGAINIYPEQARTVCANGADPLPVTLAAMAETRGLSTGVVTTTRVTHATPAAVYAHTPDRNWLHDAALPAWAKDKGCPDIARQLVEFPQGDGIDVVLGGGRASFLPETKGGKRQDGDLVQRWLEGNAERDYVTHADQLRKLDKANRRGLLGLFANAELDYESDRQASQPSLTEMTEIAINKLSQNPKGYYLMVESGRIDRAHHETKAYQALSETQEFSRAIARAMEQVNLDETLILVTADHSHAFVMAGYPARGNPILGLAKPADIVTGKLHEDPLLGKDGKPYTTLGYYAGPNQRRNESEALTEALVQQPHYQRQTAIPSGEIGGEGGVHGGDDVALYGIGPGAYLVSGLIEQNTIFHIMLHALGWGETDRK